MIASKSSFQPVTDLHRNHEQPLQRAGADRKDKSVYGFGVTETKAPLDEAVQPYESVVKSNHAPWHHMKPPSLPLYKKPGMSGRITSTSALCIFICVFSNGCHACWCFELSHRGKFSILNFKNSPRDQVTSTDRRMAGST